MRASPDGNFPPDDYSPEMNAQPIDTASAEKLTELIKDISIAMLTTVTSDGSLRSRPMATQDLPFDGDLWFFTSDDSGKTDEIAREHEVNLAYSDPKNQKYVSLSGTAQVVRDYDKARQLWKPFYKTWFPGGLEDPHLALLRVQVNTAEYWDMPSSKMVHLFGWAKSALTGTPPKDIGDHAQIDVRSSRGV